MELPPSLVHAAHFTDMEVEDVASTAKMVGSAGTNVCVIAGKSTVLHSKRVDFEYGVLSAAYTS